MLPAKLCRVHKRYLQEHQCDIASNLLHLHVSVIRTQRSNVIQSSLDLTGKSTFTQNRKGKDFNKKKMPCIKLRILVRLRVVENILAGKMKHLNLFIKQDKHIKLHNHSEMKLMIVIHL